MFPLLKSDFQLCMYEKLKTCSCMIQVSSGVELNYRKRGVRDLWCKELKIWNCKNQVDGRVDLRDLLREDYKLTFNLVIIGLRLYLYVEYNQKITYKMG